MSRGFFLLSILCLMFAASAFGQGFNVVFYYLPESGGSALTTVCQGGTALPDGYAIKVIWDNDSNGPDADDPLAPLCIDPPLCEQGPLGSVTMNTFPFNGVSAAGAAGFFYSENQFASVGALPTPSRYFLRIYEPDGITPLWTSTVYTLASGPQDIFLSGADWTCGSMQCVVIDEQE